MVEWHDVEQERLETASAGGARKDESAPAPPADGGRRRGLNGAQMAVLWLAAAALVAMVMVPPWRVLDSQRKVYCPGGYAVLWAPPEGWWYPAQSSHTRTAGTQSTRPAEWSYTVPHVDPEDTARLEQESPADALKRINARLDAILADPEGHATFRMTSGIDAYRLAAQIVGLCGVTAVAMYGLRHVCVRPRRPRRSGSIAQQREQERVPPWERPGILGWLSRPAPPRIGGWLKFWELLIVLGILGWLSVLVASYYGTTIREELGFSVGGNRTAVVAPYMAVVGLLAGALVGLWRKQRWFPGYMAGLLCIQILLNVLGVAAAGSVGSLGAAIFPAIQIAWCAVWIRYFLFSERVALTFHPDRR